MEPNEEDFDFDIIIIGAGVSGLSTAYQLWKKDPTLRVIVLEGKDRIGGRTCGEVLQGVNGRETWDMGGQWIGKGQPHIIALLKELGMESCDQFTDGKKLLQLSDNRISTYTGDIPSLPWYSLIDLHLFMMKADRMVRDIDPADPGASPDAEKWDSMTFEDLKKSMLWTKAAREVVDISGRCIFGTEPSQMSVLYYLMYASAAGGMDPLISSKKDIGGQEMKIKEGAWKVCHTILDKIGKDQVRLRDPVATIRQDDNGAVVQTLSGSEYRSQRVVLALPPNQQANIEYSPSLPTEKLNVIHRMPTGNITKVIVTYKTNFWRTAGFSGEGVTAGGSSVIQGLDHGPLCIIFDATSSNGNPAIVAFIGGQQQILYSRLNTADRKKAVLHNLSELFGREMLDCIDYREKNWNEEPYNHGGPVCVATPGILTDIAPGLRKPYGRLHFAGTESATVWCGFINGAVQSGYRAANEVLYNLRPQVITAADLEGTAYDNKPQKPRHRSGSKGRLVRWTISLGLIAGALYIAKHRGFHLETVKNYFRF